MIYAFLEARLFKHCYAKYLVWLSRLTTDLYLRSLGVFKVIVPLLICVIWMHATLWALLTFASSFFSTYIFTHILIIRFHLGPLILGQTREHHKLGNYFLIELPEQTAILASYQYLMMKLFSGGHLLFDLSIIEKNSLH